MLTSSGHGHAEEESYTVAVTDMTDNQLAGDRGNWYSLRIPLRISANDFIAQMTTNPGRYKIVFEDPHHGRHEIEPHTCMGDVLPHMKHIYVEEREPTVPDYQLRLLH